MAVPLGILGAVYLHEYGGKGRLAALIRFMTDVMTGVPSIVMGLFIYTIWTLRFGLIGLRRLAGARLPHAADRDPLDRGDAAARARRAARGQLRARQPQVAHDPHRRAARGARPASSAASCWRSPGPPARPRRCCSRSAPPRSRQLEPLRRGQHGAVAADLRQRARTPFVAAQERAWGAALTLIAIVFLFTVARPHRRAAASRSKHELTSSPDAREYLVRCRPADRPRPIAAADPSRNRHDCRSGADRPRRRRRAPTTPERSASTAPTASQGRLRRQRPDVYYGAFRAVRDVDLQIRQHEITAFIGPSGCGKTTVLRCFNRMNDLIDGARVEGKLALPRRRPLRPRASTPSRCASASAWCSRSRTRSPSRSTTTSPSVPGSPGMQGRPRRHRRAVAAQRRAVGRGEGPAEDVGARPVRRPAAAPLHRPGHRRASPRSC